MVRLRPDDRVAKPPPGAYLQDPIWQPLQPDVVAASITAATTVQAHPDPRYEAWTATGPDGMLVVTLPGGDLAVWSSRP